MMTMCPECMKELVLQVQVTKMFENGPNFPEIVIKAQQRLCQQGGFKSKPHNGQKYVIKGTKIDSKTTSTNKGKQILLKEFITKFELFSGLVSL